MDHQTPITLLDTPPIPNTPQPDARFNAILAFTLRWETVRDRHGRVLTTRHPNDPGGATRYGIDQRSHPTVAIDRLTEDQARQIYHRTYWAATAAPTLPEPIGEALFDIGVLQGTGTAARLLQRALAVRPDGRIGPITRAAIARAPDPATVAAALINLAEDRLSTLHHRNPQLAVFRRGWLRRMADLRRHLRLPPRA
jgi:lysozyme family protein